MQVLNSVNRSDIATSIQYSPRDSPHNSNKLHVQELDIDFEIEYKSDAKEQKEEPTPTKLLRQVSLSIQKMNEMQKEILELDPNNHYNLSIQIQNLQKSCNNMLESFTKLVQKNEEINNNSADIILEMPTPSKNKSATKKQNNTKSSKKSRQKGAMEALIVLVLFLTYWLSLFYVLHIVIYRSLSEPRYFSKRTEEEIHYELFGVSFGMAFGNLFGKQRLLQHALFLFCGGKLTHFIYIVGWFIMLLTLATNYFGTINYSNSNCD